MAPVEHLNPDGLSKNPAFTQAIAVTGPARTIYLSGQNSVDASGALVAQGDLAAQTRQVVRNLRTALAAGGAGVEHLVKCTIHLVQGQSAQTAFQAWMVEAGARLPKPPTVTLLFVSGLAHPDYLIELDAVAVVPESHGS
ncbi:RidA family protein [Myxococcaceae bacterium GXIMD 01537]